MTRTVPNPRSHTRAAKSTRGTLRLAGLGDGQLVSLITGAADLTLLLDSEGVVRDAAFASDALAREFGDSWRDLPWLDSVAEDCHAKATAMLAAAQAGERPRWRQINLRQGSARTLSMDCSAVTLTEPHPQAGSTLVMGRDERASAALQQRLIEAQLAVERDYTRFRQAELRYRHLFQMGSDAMLVLEAASNRITEANPAACELLGLPADKLIGQVFPVGLAARSQKAVLSLLAGARRAVRSDPVPVRLADNRRELRLSATLLNQDNTSLLLVRLQTLHAAGAASPASEAGLLLLMARQAPDALVVTNAQGQVQACNPAFVQLTQVSGPELARGQSLERWLGRSGVDLGVLLSNLRQSGSVKLFATTLRDELGVSTEVEISAVTAQAASGSGDDALLGFAIRDVGRRLSADPGPVRGLPGSVNQLTELVGRVPMKDIVSETSDLIEKLCIEAALELTRDNRASAAEILGLSRQSLYVKLRRYGLGDLGSGGDK